MRIIEKQVIDVAAFFHSRNSIFRLVSIRKFVVVSVQRGRRPRRDYFLLLIKFGAERRNGRLSRLVDGSKRKPVVASCRVGRGPRAATIAALLFARSIIELRVAELSRCRGPVSRAGRVRRSSCWVVSRTMVYWTRAFSRRTRIRRRCVSLNAQFVTFALSSR